MKKKSKRAAEVQVLFEATGNFMEPTFPWIYDCLYHRYPEKLRRNTVDLSNLLTVSIVEFHLACARMCTLILPATVEIELPNIDGYLEENKVGTLDMCILNSASIKHFTVWLYQLDMIATQGLLKVISMVKEDHKIEDLL